MGKAGRFACIFVPMALTLASLACLAIVFMGNTNKGSTFLSDLYFMKVSTATLLCVLLALLCANKRRQLPTSPLHIAIGRTPTDTRLHMNRPIQVSLPQTPR